MKVSGRAGAKGDRVRRGAVPVMAVALLALGCAADAARSDEGAGGESAGARAAAGSGTAEMVTAEFDVAGMTCGGCALATEVALRKLDGVRSAEASYDQETGEGRCRVEYDPRQVGTAELMAAIEAVGFRPSLRAPPERS